MNGKWLQKMILAAGVFVIAGCLLQSVIGNNVAEAKGEDDPYSEELFAMDTIMTLTAYGEGRKEAVTAAKKEVQHLDALLSAGKMDSEISIVNENGGGTISLEAAELVERASELYEKTGGLFDCTIYPVMSLWGFTTQEYHVPTEAELQEALSLVDGSEVELERIVDEASDEKEELAGAKISLGEGQQMDLGGIGKGYASARLMEIFKEYGISSAIVSLGGNVQVLNTKPDGTAWKVGIQDPADNQGEILGVVEVSNQAVITSGGYERYFEEDGKTYIHIIDPRTGYPVENELDSVTILSPDGTLADALSTSLYIMGLDDAIAYWKISEDPFDVIFVKKDGTVVITEGIAESFRTDRTVEVVSK